MNKSLIQNICPGHHLFKDGGTEGVEIVLISFLFYVIAMQSLPLVKCSDGPFDIFPRTDSCDYSMFKASLITISHIIWIFSSCLSL